MKELNAIKDFVLSLEATKLNDGQQSVLLVGEELYGSNDGTNYRPNCICNNNVDCIGSVNGTCTNKGDCMGSSNGICNDGYSKSGSPLSLENPNSELLNGASGFSGF